MVYETSLEEVKAELFIFLFTGLFYYSWRRFHQDIDVLSSVIDILFIIMSVYGLRCIPEVNPLKYEIGHSVKTFILELNDPHHHFTRAV